MAKNNSTEPQQGGTNDFTLVEKYKLGYRAREDITTLPPGVMVSGSQNVLTNTFQRVGLRKGYTLDGEANTDAAPIANNGPAMGVFDWLASSGEERHMRAGFLTDAGNDGKLQFRFEESNGDVSWVDLMSNLTSVDFNYTTFFDTSTLQTVLLMVNGSSNLYVWGGVTVTVDSAANPTGILAQIPQPLDESPGTVSGGKDFTPGDVLNISGGNNDATIEVLSVYGGTTVDTASINAGGMNYAVNDFFSIDQSPDGATTWFKVTGVDGGGGVTSFDILNPGVDLIVDTGLATITQSGVGTGLTIDVDSVTGGSIRSWRFASDADHGTGYSGLTKYTLTGGTGTLAYIFSLTIDSGSITKTGTESWAQAGFVFGPTHFSENVIINGTTYTYDSLNFIGDTTTLYGITPDPSGLSPGDTVIQSVVTIPNAGGSNGLPTTFKNSLITTYGGRVWIGSLQESYIYFSNLNSYTTWAPSTDFVVLDTSPQAFVILQESFYISAGKANWYYINVLLSADLNTSGFLIKPINTAAQQGSQSQAWTTKIANQIAFLSFEPVMEAFGPIQNILGVPQMVDLSYSIVNDMNQYDFTGGSAAYFQKMLYMAVPREGLVLIYNMTDPQSPYWEAPQVLPISRFSIIDGELYGHSSQVSETYKLFTGTNDNGHAIVGNATFAFNNYGTRSQTKGYNEFYVEGYILPNTTLKLNIQYDIDGCARFTNYNIVGNDSQIVCLVSDDGSLGKASLGKHPLGAGLTSSEDPNMPKFRVIKTFPTNYFYEDQISFSSSGKDLGWEIVAFGPQLLAGGNLNNTISQ